MDAGRIVLLVAVAIFFVLLLAKLRPTLDDEREESEGSEGSEGSEESQESEETDGSEAS
jgi:hypothetical protein